MAQHSFFVEDRAPHSFDADRIGLELGHEVVGPTAESAQALAYVRQEAVDAAFVDIEVKDGDAYSLADELKRLLIPFTFATGYPADTIDHRFSDIPSLGKPFDYDGFNSALQRMVSRAGSTSLRS